MTHELVLPIWKSNVSVGLMIDKKAKSALSLRLFGEDITVAAKDASKKREQAVAVDAEGKGDSMGADATGEEPST